MGKLVKPEVFLVGQTVIDMDGVREYLKQSGNEDFLETMRVAKDMGIQEGEILCSMMGKICYASLTLGKNKNVSRVRDIPDNFKAILDSGHGSVLEHCQLNFVVRNCSRIYETEQVRHRVGTAYSILSGRYFRSDILDVVADPILQQHDILKSSEQDEIHEFLEAWMIKMSERIEAKEGNFDTKKKLTSAARRWMPQGRATEVGMSLNLRTLRHLVQLRTARSSEWEIRTVYAQVYEKVKVKYPLIFCDARERDVDGALEVYGMKLQPYETRSDE